MDSSSGALGSLEATQTGLEPASLRWASITSGFLPGQNSDSRGWSLPNGLKEEAFQIPVGTLSLAFVCGDFPGGTAAAALSLLCASPALSSPSQTTKALLCRECCKQLDR